MDKIKYFTTPIYYVNAKPHIGHAYTTIAADILSRYYRDIKGCSVFMLTGTDEHGQKVEKAASAQDLGPKEYTDTMIGEFKKLWRQLNISDHGFIRTTDAGHKQVVRNSLQRLYEKGEIEKRAYSGWYCVADERFWTEKDLIEGKCPDCHRAVEEIEEENYFFLMSKYQQRLTDYIEDNKDYIMPEMRKNEVLGFLKNNKLEDLCISRPSSRLSWGIPLPFDESYVTYVWFDALLNYYSAKDYIFEKECWPATVHIVGKDILTTHSVYWSTMLMALDIELPRHIFAHGWWMLEEEKMSKSLGNIVDPMTLIDEFGADAFRFYLFRNSIFGKDASFSYEGFKKTYETELANELGNLLSRVLSMIQKYKPDFYKAEEYIYAGLPNGEGSSKKNPVEKFDEFYEELDFYNILKVIWDIVRAVNRDIEDKKPWDLAKNDTESLGKCLGAWFRQMKLIAGFLYPFMPETSNKMKQQMGLQQLSERELLDPGVKIDYNNIKKGDPLFPKQH